MAILSTIQEIFNRYIPQLIGLTIATTVTLAIIIIFVIIIPEDIKLRLGFLNIVKVTGSYTPRQDNNTILGIN